MSFSKPITPRVAQLQLQPVAADPFAASPSKPSVVRVQHSTSITFAAWVTKFQLQLQPPSTESPKFTKLAVVRVQHPDPVVFAPRPPELQLQLESATTKPAGVAESTTVSVGPVIGG